MFDLELERIIDLIRNNKYKILGIQLPEGLKDRATEIVNTIEKNTGVMVYIFGNPCYGACDLADSEALELGCDALIHFGHSEIFGKTKIPFHYIHVRSDRDPLPLLSENLGVLPKKIGVITTIQHIHLIDKIVSSLENAGIEAYTGKSSGRVKFDGQVLGCSFSSAETIKDKVDAYLYIGTGDFHPLGVTLATGKKTFVLDLERGVLRDIEDKKESILRKRFAKIAIAQDGKKFGIIVGEKIGQKRVSLAIELKKMLEEQGKRGYLISLREVTPDTLLPFRHLDAFVNTACPRIAIDDADRYKKPLLTPVELEIVLGNRGWENYRMDEIP